MDEMRFDGKPKSYSSLDVTVLHTLILEGALGIDPREYGQSGQPSVYAQL